MFRRCILSVVSLMVLLGVLIVTLAWQSYRAYSQDPDEDASAVAFAVEEGESLSSVATRLDDDGFIASAFWFKVVAAFSNRSTTIKPGMFMLTPGTNYNEILTVISTSQSNEVTLTIPEGFTLPQIGELVVANFEVTEAEWAELTGISSPFETHEFVVAAQKPDDVDLEGYLFPDTYRFFADATGEEIVRTLLDTMAERVGELGDLGGRADEMTTHEMLALASIIEREVRTETSRRNVADIFLKRLDIGMPLQSDATINYIIDGDDPSPTLADLEVESPYNTYKYPGLPPGPISSPGLMAIKAIFEPIANDYYYFLTTDEGDIYFAATHDEHVDNKRRYLD